MPLNRIAAASLRAQIPGFGLVLVIVFGLMPVSDGQEEAIPPKGGGGASVAESSGASDPAVLQDREMIRRRALMEEAQELMGKGKEAFAAGKPQEALEAFAGVREVLPDAPMTAEIRNEALALYIKAAIARATVLAEQGDLKGAKTVMQRALAEDMAPQDPSALDMLARLNDPVRYNQSMNADHAANVDKVMELLTKGAHSLDLALYDDAAACYKQVLGIDPYNKAATQGLELIALYKSDAARTGYDQTRAQRLAEVDAQWRLGLSPDVAAAGLPAVGGAAEFHPGRISIEDKLERIMVPQVAFEQVTLEEAIQFLRVVSASEDKLTLEPEHRGINFNINLAQAGGGDTSGILTKRFDLQLRNVPLSHVLKQLNQLTRTSYLVDDFSVIITSAGAGGGELMNRAYRVPPDFIADLSVGLSEQAPEDPFAEQASPKGLLTRRLGIKELLTKKGVVFPEGASASLSPGSSLLQVTNTASAHALIERIIEISKEKEPIAVSVELKILKIQQDNLKELGMDWLLTPFDLGQGVFLGGGTKGSAPGRVAGDFSPVIPLPSDPTANVQGLLTSGLRSGSQIYNTDSIDALIANPYRTAQSIRAAPGVLALTGVLADGQVQAVFRGLDQKKGTDMIATPAVVTRSGQQAKVEIVREFIYPTEYDPPELPAGGGGGVDGGAPVARLVTPANPTAFDTRNVGISLDVLPVADDDKRYIDITLNPEFVDFDGFVNFGTPIMTIAADEDGNEAPVMLTANQILMPVFSVKRANTQLTVADGATIAYAGLMTETVVETEDKVPVLGELPMVGNLFTNTAYKPVRTVIVFLVHVQLLDPTGRPYRQIVNP